MIGRRGLTLLFFALLDLVYAFGLAFPTPRSANNPTNLFLEAIRPMPFWVTIWAGVGVICLVGAFWKRAEMVAFYSASSLKVFVAVVFLAGEVTGQVERGYVSAAIWGALAAVVLVLSGWNENHHQPIGGDDG